MLNTTLERLVCPLCRGKLSLHPVKKAGGQACFEVSMGHLACAECRENFPILAGVAILVPDVREYMSAHAKGIAQIVRDDEIPREFLDDYLEAKHELEIEHIEEDLEAERVNALYLMNHYLTVNGSNRPGWWSPTVGEGSPLIDSLVREYWDQGPLSKIASWMSTSSPRANSVVEVGCGVGGLSKKLRGHVKSYLGVDSAFASIALARHLALGVPYPRAIKIPGDLLDGAVSRAVKLDTPSSFDGSIDFLVGEIESLPVVEGEFDASIALNAIDMLNEPEGLPKLQSALVRSGGVVIQSCPYIWHANVSAELRKILPADVKDSARAVEWLYTSSGLKIEQRVEHLPWLFFKQVRQLEIYSVHLFLGRKI